MKKALFLDRDGIINIDHGYVYKKEEFEFVTGIFDLCRHAQQAGYNIYVITNQSGIGRGKYTEQEFHMLSKWMVNEFKKHSVTISDVYFCPHHPEKAKPEYLKSCKCRKPEPGMILKAAQDYSIDLANSVFIGDKISDMKAAQNAGIPSRVLVSSAYGDDIEISAIRVKNVEDIINTAVFVR